MSVKLLKEETLKAEEKMTMGHRPEQSRGEKEREIERARARERERERETERVQEMYAMFMCT